MGFLAERERAGFTQGEVARKLGVTDAAVSMWETGKTSPRAVLLPRIAALYGCTVDSLLTEKDGEKNGTACM